jgi:hypothetical protein
MGSILRDWQGFHQFPAATQSKLVELFAKLKEEVPFFNLLIQIICSTSSLIVSVFIIIYCLGLLYVFAGC